MQIAKREFIQHTSVYLKAAEHEEVIITHHGKPCLKLQPLHGQKLHLSDLQGAIKIDINEKDINSTVLDEFDL